MREFDRAARESFSGTMQEMESIKDQPLKDFMLREVPKEQQPEVGVVNHLSLWDSVYKHSGSQDANFMASMRRGFPSVGEREFRLTSGAPSSHQPTLSSMRETCRSGPGRCGSESLRRSSAAKQ